MGGNLRDKFISNTYTKIFQKSELPEAEGNENIDLNEGLTDDSLTLTNGLGQKVRFFVLDVGDPSMGDGNGIYIQTQNMKSSGDFGLRFNSNNERGQITSKNKDILISSDFNDDFKRKTILKGGIPGTMSGSANADDLNGGSVGNPEQLTLQLQGRLSVEHDEAIFLNDDRNQELGLMSGVFKGEGPEEIQIWSKVGNVVNVCGSWRWDPSSIGGGASTVPMYLNIQRPAAPQSHFWNYIFSSSFNVDGVNYNSNDGTFTITQNGNYAISGTIYVRYKRINTGVSAGFPIGSDVTQGRIFQINSSLRPNVWVFKHINGVESTSPSQNTSLPPSNNTNSFYLNITSIGPQYHNDVVVPPNDIGDQSIWYPISFNVSDMFSINDKFTIKYYIEDGIVGLPFNWYELLTQQFEVEFGNGSFVRVNGTTIASMGAGDAGGIPDYSTDLRFPIINGRNITRVWGNAKFRNESVNNYGYIKENADPNNRFISASFYQGNSLSTQSLGPVDFSYSYILEF